VRATIAAGLLFAALLGGAAAPGTEDGSPDAAVSSCLAAAPNPRACIGAYADPCMETPQGSTTVGMADCLAAEIAEWEARADDAFKRLRALARSLDEAAPETEALAALRRAHRAWTAFREAECRAVAAPYSGGTIYGVAFTQCSLTLSAERALAQTARAADLESR